MRKVTVGWGCDSITYDVSEIAIKMDVSGETIRRWIRNGELKATKQSNKNGYRIERADFLEFIRNYPIRAKWYYARKDMKARRSVLCDAISRRDKLLAELKEIEREIDEINFEQLKEERK